MTSPWQILAVGGATVALIFVATANLTWAYAVASGCLLLMFAAGFFFQSGEYFSLTLPAIDSTEWRPRFASVDIGAAFPQQMRFRVTIVRMWLLLAVALVPLAILIWIYAGGHQIDEGHGFPPTNITIVPFYLFGTLYALLRSWLKERRLLRRAGVSWGLLEPIENGVRYQFASGPEGRTGGAYVSKFRSPTPGDTVDVIFFDPKQPEESVPGYSFLFHSVTMIDRKHLSARAEGSSS